MSLYKSLPNSKHRAHISALITELFYFTQQYDDFYFSENICFMPGYSWFWIIFNTRNKS